MYWNILISLYLKDWTCCVGALQQLVLPTLMHFVSHFEHWPEKSRCLFQSRAAADSLALQPCTLNHSNLICIWDGGEVVSYPDPYVTFTVFIWQFLTVCTMEKPKGELKTNKAAVPTYGTSNLLSVIEQWQRWCSYGLRDGKLSWWLVQVPVCTSGIGSRRQYSLYFPLPQKSHQTDFSRATAWPFFTAASRS